MEKSSSILFTLLMLLALYSLVLADNTCISGSPTYSKLYYLDGVEIKEKDLRKVIVGEHLKIKIVFMMNVTKKSLISTSMN